MGKRKPEPQAIVQQQKQANNKKEKKNKNKNNNQNNQIQTQNQKKNQNQNHNQTNQSKNKNQTQNQTQNQKQNHKQKNKRPRLEEKLVKEEVKEVEDNEVEQSEDVEEVEEVEEQDGDAEEAEVEEGEGEEIEEEEGDEESESASDSSDDEGQYAFDDEEEDENVGKGKEGEGGEERETWVPRPIKVPNFTFDLQFHPTEDYIACSDVGGRITLYKYGSETTRVYRKQIHTQSCRCIKFSQDSKYLISGSTDLSLKATDALTGNIVYDIQNAHQYPINALATRGNYVCTGDDEGYIKFWDSRRGKCIFEQKVTSDFISDIHITDKNKVITTSADGQLSIFSIDKKKLQFKVDNLDDELLCLADTGKYIVMGSQSGMMGTVKWGEYEELSRMDSSSHPSSIDSILPFSHNSVFTACSDGVIRIVKIVPSKVLHVVGNHDGFMVEQLAYRKDNNLLASVGHDMHIRFWDINAVLNGPTVQEQEAAALQPVKSNANQTTNIFTNIHNTLSSASSSLSSPSATTADSSYNAVNYTLDNTLTTTVPELKEEELNAKPKRPVKKAAMFKMQKASFFNDL